LARNYGTTQEAHDFFLSIQGLKENVINKYYTRPGKFANAVRYFKRNLMWDPVRIPAEELKIKSNKQSPTDQKDDNQQTPPSNHCATNSHVTPLRQTNEDNAKAIHKPNKIRIHKNYYSCQMK
jgi:hypothetical protein